MKKPDLTLFMVCDQADLVGKQFGRAVNHIIGPALPMTVEHLSIATEWRHGCGHFNFQIKIGEPGGEAIYMSQVQEFTLKNEDERFEAVAELRNVAFRNIGTHRVEVYLGAEEVFNYPISVNIEPIRRDRVDFFSRPKEERIKLLSSERHDEIIKFLANSLEVITVVASEKLDRVRRIEDKTAHLLPVALVIPVLLFSGIFGKNSYGNAIRVLPVFVLATIFCVNTLWPFRLPHVTEAFVADPRDAEGLDSFYSANLFYQQEIFRYANGALEKKVSKMKYAYLFTVVGFFATIILLLLAKTNAFYYLQETAAVYTKCRYLPDLVFVSLTIAIPFILSKTVFKKPETKTFPVAEEVGNRRE